MKRKLGSKQMKRLRELNVELTLLKESLTPIVNHCSKKQTTIQGRFVDFNEIPFDQCLPIWWENKEIQ